MSFIKFTEVGKSFSPQAQINPWGVISFNTGACKKYGIGEHSHCIMYLDQDTHTMAFEMVDDENLDGANPIRRLRTDGVDINGHAFLNYFHLRFGHAMRFQIHRHPETGWLTLDLGHPNQTPHNQDQQTLTDQIHLATCPDTMSTANTKARSVKTIISELLQD